MESKPQENFQQKALRPGRRRKLISKKIQMAHRRAQLMAELERNPAVTMPELADRFKVNEKTVWNDMQAITKFYRARAVDSREVWLGKMLRHYDAIYSEAHTAWEKSCEEKKIRVVQSGGEGGGFTQSRKESQHGDSSLLKVKVAALAQMAKLLGLDAPLKANVTVQNADATALLQGVAQLCARALVAMAAAGNVAPDVQASIMGAFSRDATAFLDGAGDAKAKGRALGLECDGGEAGEDAGELGESEGEGLEAEGGEGEDEIEVEGEGEPE